MNKKIMIIFTIFILLLSFLTSSVYAIDDIVMQGEDFISNGESQIDSKGNPIEDDALKSVSSTIYNILLAIAIVLAVAVAAVLGISFMLGSIDEQAKVKESLIPFVIGCIVVFGAFGIWKVLANLLQGV